MSTDTSAPAYLPAAKEVRDLLGDLLDKEVNLRPGPPFGVSAFYPASVASYVDDSLTVRAIVALDLPLTAFAGAALALVPLKGAQDAVEAGRVEGALAESIREVFNIVASVFNTPSAPHLRLYNAVISGEVLPGDLRARTQILGRRADFMVEVGGYGTGRFSIVLC